MRCWKARRKLTESLETGSEIVNDAALIDHLEHCPACAARYEAWRSVRHDLKAAAQSDLTETLPLAALKGRVEAMAAGADVRRPKERSVMAALFEGLRTRPRYGLGLAALVAVVALSILIPLRYDRNAVGYEVALAGVDKDLAMDTAKVNEFLVQLGVKGAGVTVSDCEETCKLKITKLKTQDDAKLVMAAFGDVAKVSISASAYEVASSDSGRTVTLICNLDSLEADNILFADSVHKIVIERCGADFDGSNMIWFTLDSSGGSTMHLNDGDIEFRPGEPINLDDARIAELEVQGIRISTGHLDDESWWWSLTTGLPGSDSLAEFRQQDSTAAKPESTLPEGYELEQNYPNPFNPTTRIAFTLPSAQRAKLQVFNVQGRLVKTLIDGEMEAGSHAVEWHATDDSGAPVASGVYLYRLTTAQGSVTKKMSLVK